MLCGETVEALYGCQGNKCVQAYGVDYFVITAYGNQIHGPVGYPRWHVVGDGPEAELLDHHEKIALKSSVNGAFASKGFGNFEPGLFEMAFPQFGITVQVLGHFNLQLG
jgi:hypothetical protein